MTGQSASVVGLPTNLPEPYLTRQQLADLMGVSVDTIDRLRKQGMPSVRWGRRTVRFRASTAIAWANAQAGHFSDVA